MTNDEIPNGEGMTNDEARMTKELLGEALTNVVQQSLENGKLFDRDFGKRIPRITDRRDAR